MRKEDKLLVQQVRKRGRPFGSTKENIAIKKRELIVPEVNDNKFKKGKVGGPGRPLGSRSKFTMALEAVGESNAVRVYQKMVDLALEGDTVAGKIILDRVLPARKDRRVDLDLKGSVKTPEAISALSTKVTDMMVTGEISPSESIEIGNRIEQHLKVLTDVDIINKIEGTCEKIDKMPRIGE